MGEHTPGPWTTRVDGWQPWPGAIQILGPDMQIIAYTSAGTNEKADAPLLAAAPALVKALRNSSDALQYCLSVLPLDELLRTKVQATFNAAREALAKVSQP